MKKRLFALFFTATVMALSPESVLADDDGGYGKSRGGERSRKHANNGNDGNQGYGTGAPQDWNAGNNYNNNYNNNNYNNNGYNNRHDEGGRKNKNRENNRYPQGGNGQSPYPIDGNQPGNDTAPAGNASRWQ